jgi:hypothetical protein
VSQLGLRQRRLGDPGDGAVLAQTRSRRLSIAEGSVPAQSVYINATYSKEKIILFHPLQLL